MAQKKDCLSGVEIIKEEQALGLIFKRLQKAGSDSIVFFDGASGEYWRLTLTKEED